METLHLQTTRAFGFNAFDFDGNGHLDMLEVSAAVRSLLNAPLFSIRDAAAWIRGSTGKPNLSLAWLADEDHLAFLAFRSKEVFSRIFEQNPEKLTRHSFQTSLSWDAAGSLASELSVIVDDLVDKSLWNRLQLAEPLQIIRYMKTGHYAPHSDARPITTIKGIVSFA